VNQARSTNRQRNCTPRFAGLARNRHLTVTAISILIIDPEAEFTSILTDRLNSWGFAATAVNSCADAMDWLEHSRPEVVVLGLEAGNREGLNLLGWIRTRHPELKIIVLAGKGATLAAMNSLANGVFDLLPQPVELGVLIDAIRRAQRKQRRR